MKENILTHTFHSWIHELNHKILNDQRFFPNTPHAQDLLFLLHCQPPSTWANIFLSFISIKQSTPV